MLKWYTDLDPRRLQSFDLGAAPVCWYHDTQRCVFELVAHILIALVQGLIY